MNYIYRIRMDRIIDEEGEMRTVYGIEAVEVSASAPKPEHSIPDLFTERGRAEELVELCNRLELDPAHLLAVCEDALV